MPAMLRIALIVVHVALELLPVARFGQNEVALQQRPVRLNVPRQHDAAAKAAAVELSVLHWHGEEHVLALQQVAGLERPLGKHAALQAPERFGLLVTGCLPLIRASQGLRHLPRLDPAVGLLRRGAIGVQLDGVGRHPDMAFEQPRAVSHRHLHGRDGVRIFMGRPADANARIALPQHGDVQQIAGLGRRRIDGHAMHQREIQRPMLAEHDEIVHVGDL